MQLATFGILLAVQYCETSFYNLIMEQDLRKKLAYNIKVERAKHELTQEKLAELAGISAKHITKIENLKVTPSIYIVYKIAKIFNISLDDLLK